MLVLDYAMIEEDPEIGDGINVEFTLTYKNEEESGLAQSRAKAHRVGGARELY
jgi:hypothetical protein